jgi:putative membrane protein
MMFWYDHGMTGWGWAMMTISMIVFWVLVIGLGVLLFRALRGGPQDSIEAGPSVGSPPRRPTPEQLLAERYARGEIDEEEYQRRLDTLHGTGPHLTAS